MSRGRSPSLTGQLAHLPADACRFPPAGTSRCAVSASAVPMGPTMANRKPNDHWGTTAGAPAPSLGVRKGSVNDSGPLVPVPRSTSG